MRMEQVLNRSAPASEIFLALSASCSWLPAVGDGFQQGDQGGGRGKDHLVLRAEFNQGGVRFQGRLEKGFPRQEHDDEFGARGKLGKIILGAQLLEVSFYVRGVAGHPLAALLQPVRLPGIQVGGHGGLRVNDDGTASRQVDDHIRRTRSSSLERVSCVVKSQYSTIPGQLHHGGAVGVPPTGRASCCGAGPGKA